MGLGGYLVWQKSASGDAVLTTTYADDNIVKGNAFEVKRTISINAGATVKLIFDHTALAETDLIFVLPLQFFGTGGPVEIKTYRVSTYTGGTILPANKINTISAKTALGVVKTGITSTDAAGDDLREYLLGAAGNAQQVNRSGASTGASAVIIKGGSAAQLCMEVTNSYTSAIRFNAGIVWYELIGANQ